MKFFDYIRFALKNLWRQRLRSILTIIAIVVGALSVISMISLVLGASDVFVQQLRSTGALTQVRVTASTDVSSDDAFGGGGGNTSTTGVILDDASLAKVKAIPHVTDATPLLQAYPLRSFQLQSDASAKQYNLDSVEAYTPGSVLTQTLAAGRQLLPSDDANVIILGGQQAAKLGAANVSDLIGQTLIFTMQPGYSGVGATITPPPANGGDQKAFFDNQQKQITKLEAKIIGVTAGSDDRTSYITLNWAKGMMERISYQQDQKAMQAWQQAQQEAQQQAQKNHSGQPAQLPQPPFVKTVDSDVTRNGYSQIVAQVDDANNVADVAVAVKAMKYGAATAQEILDKILSIFKIIGLVFGAIGAISLGVAAIGVINTMVMATLERTREIGVMRACGATRGAVAGLFTFEASMLGFWGGVIGVALGYGLSKIANVVIGRLLVQQHLAATNVVQIPIWLSLAVIGATTIIGLLAGLYPAIRASRLNPVEALRYE